MARRERHTTETGVISNMDSPSIPRRRSRSGALTFVAALLTGVGGTACEFLDPTDVDNPRTTPEDLAQAAEPTKALLPGLRAQFARATRTLVVLTEVVSDNYSIHGTGLDKQYDDPRGVSANVANSTSDFSVGVYPTAQELRALADFVVDVIAPEDATATPEQVSEARYYRGMAFLYLGENFTHAPTAKDGVPVPASELLDRALADLGAVTGDFRLRALAAQARAYRARGDAQAEQRATEALAQDASFVFSAGYDSGNLENSPFSYLFLRPLQEMQPLPRLDFLDPKYLARDADIAVAKAEEMHLILAEAKLARSDVGGGRAHLVDAIRLARSRGTTNFVDNDPRGNLDTSVRPRDAVIQVRADANSPYRAGLVLNRPDASIPIPTVSGTSLDPDSVAALTDLDQVWHAFHLARQEILFLEGRRMSDLGIRLPIMLREIDANPNLNPGDPGTAGLVPTYIPQGEEMDLFDPKSPYEGTLLDSQQRLVSTQVTIRVDMNKVLTTNRVTPFG